MIPCALWAALDRQATPERGFARYAVAGTAAWAACVVQVGGDFMQYRFMWELTPLFLAAGLLGASRLRTSLAVALSALSLALAPVPPVMENRFGMQTIEDMNRMAREGVRVGKALAELPDDTVVATTLAGTVSYYSGLTVIDQWGLNDAYVGRLDIGRPGSRGHVKFAPQEYLTARGVHLYMAHPVFTRCDKPSREIGKSNVFIRTAGNECVRTWYLQQTPELTPFVCQHPDRFILHNVSCGT